MFKPALRWWWWAVAVVGVWLLLGADLTDAATVTVGSPLTAPFFSTSTCGSPCTRANTALADPGANVTSPITGTVVRYRLAGNYGGTFMLRVLRPAGGGQYTGAGTSGPTSANGTATIAIPTSLPIQTGDLIGMDLGSGNHLSSATFTGSAFSQWLPPLADNSTGAPTSPPTNNLELLFNADVQPPPGINSIKPTSGSVSGGTKVTIKGHDFSGTSVTFGNVPATSLTVDTDNQVTAVSPASSKVGPVDVHVTTAAGTTPAVAADQFTYEGCVVPKLKGKTLHKAKAKLRKADCKLGKVSGHGTAVKKQSLKRGKVRPPHTKVNVTLG